MASCMIINNPRTKERINSRLYRDLVSFDKNNADSYFQKTISDEYVDKYGDWTNPVDGGFIFEVDENGEPEFNRPFVESIESFEQPRAELKDKLVSFIKGMGFTYESVDNILSKGGDSVSGVTDFLLQTVNVVNGAPENVLAEEAAHVYVEWLEQKNPTLFRSLYNDITQFKAYRDVLDQYSNEYNGDSHTLRKEAMGKVISDIIINGKSELDIDNRVKNWWSKVKQFLKDLVGVSNNQIKDYLQIADDIVSGNMKGVINKSDYRLYNISSPKIQAALQRLSENSKKVTSTKQNGLLTYEFNGNPIKNTVQDILLNEYKKKFDKIHHQAKETEYLDENEKNKVGVDDIINIANRFVEKQNGGVVTPVTNNLKINNLLHTKLTKAIEDTLNSFGPNAKVYTDINVYNKSKNISSTINLMVVDSSGTVHILDFRFLDSKPTSDQRNLWNREMNENRSILEGYGFTSFGKIRNVVIESTKNNGNITGITVDNKPLIENAIPAFTETTSNKDLNLVIKKLQDQFNKLSKTGSKNESDRINRSLRLSQINRVINEIQINENLEPFYFMVKNRINEIEVDLSNPNFDVSKNLKPVLSELEYYTSLSGLNRLDVDNTGKPLNRFSFLISNALNLQVTAKDMLYDHFANQGLDLKVDMLRPSTTMDRLSTLSVHKNKIFKMFNSLKSKAEDIIDKEQRQFNNRVGALIEQLKKEENTSNLFDKILNKKDGKYDGTLMRKYRKDYWEKLSKEDVSWIEANTIFKPNAKAEFDRALAEYEASKLKYAFTDKQKAAVSDQVEEYRKKYDFWNPKYKKTAYEHYQKTKSSRYISPSESMYSDQYRYIIDNPNLAISKLYHEFHNVIEEGRKYSPDYLSDSFIPSLEKSFVSKVLTAGGIKNMQKDLQDFYTAPPYENVVDEEGNIAYKIPLKYTFDLKGEKSLDLGTVFSMFNHSVLQNKHLSEIENEALLMENALLEAKYNDVDWRGGVKKDEFGQTIELNSSSEEGKKTIKHFREHVNNSIYQVKDETKPFEVFGVSGIKAIDGMINYFSLAKLGLNVFTGVSNFVGGEVMLYSTAGRTKHFDKKHVANAQSLITTGNNKAKAAIEFFDILTSDTTHKKAKQLSTSFVEKNLTLDKLYVMMERGEWFIQNSALVAFLDANTIENGTPRRKQDGEQSMLELLGEDANGNIEIQGLSDEGFNIVRKRMRGIAAEVMGSLSEREVLLAQRHVLGRAMLQFKRWMLPMGRLRFGSLTYNENLDEFEEGRFRRFFSDFVQGNMLKNAADITTSLFTAPNQSMLDKIRDIYDRHIESNPDFADLTFEEYTDLYMRNLKSTIYDFIALGSMTVLLAGMNMDDDEDKTNSQSIASKMLAKSLTELTFWVDTDSFTKLFLNNVVPVVSLVKDVTTLTKEVVTLDKDGVIKQGTKLVPLWKQFEVYENMYNEYLNK